MGLFISFVVASAGAFAACTSASGDSGADPGGDDGGVTDGASDGGFILDGAGPVDIATLSLDPGTSTIQSVDGAPVKQTYKLIGTHTDGTSVDLPRVVPVRASGIFHGDGWMGVKMRDASVVKGVGVLPMFAGLIGLLLLLGAFAATWVREGR